MYALHSNFVGGSIAHTWSLSVEEQFYVVWPLLLLVLLARGASLRTVAIVALAGAALSDIGKLALWMGGGSLGADANRMFGTDLSGDALLIGCALAVAARIHPHQTARIARVAAIPGALYLAVVVTIIHPFGGSFADTRAFMVIGWPMTSVAAAAVIGHVALQESWMSRLLAFRPLTYIGRISYGLYIWHYPIIVWSIVWFGALSKWPLWQIAAEVAAVFVIAIASYHLVEVRALRLKGRMRPQHQYSAATPAVPPRPSSAPGSRDPGLGHVLTLGDTAAVGASVPPADASGATGGTRP